MSNQELYFLGYEDMEEFKNYCNDFADLFINKPGYIFKFQNFSWINYALHSGTPNKKVLIRTKHGKEIEASLVINEIFLAKEFDSASSLFCIEISNSLSGQERLNIPTETTDFAFGNKEENSFSMEPKDASPETSFVKQTIDFSGNTSFEPDEDYVPDNSHSFVDTPLEGQSDAFFTSSLPPEELATKTMDFKLKFDNYLDNDDIPAKETSFDSSTRHLEYSSIDEIKIDDLDFKVNVEAYPDDNLEDLQNDSNLSIEKPKKDEEEAFDLALIAEELGLEIGLIAQIVGEYADEIDSKMPLISQYIENNSLDLAQNEIEKLKSIALNLSLTSLFYQFEHLEKSLRYDTKEELKHSFNNLSHAIALFKTNLQ